MAIPAGTKQQGRLMPELVIKGKHVFDANHVFYEEILTYAVTQVSSTFAHYLRSGQSLPAKNFVLNRGRIVDSLLRNTDEVLVALATKGIPSQFVYDEADASGVPTGQRAPDYRFPPEAWMMISQVCLGSAYERVKHRISAHYGADPWQWPPELQYFRHVRDGCFHSNSFILRASHKHKTAIDSSNPPKWRISILQNDESVHGQPVFGKHLYSGDVPILLADIAQVLLSLSS